MIFGRKYIFETRATRMKRLFLGTLTVISFFILLFVILCTYLPLYAKQENEKAAAAFFKKAPDLVVVFTGDAGRISSAIKTARESENTQVLISGVFATNTLKQLLTPAELAEILDKQIDIDYLPQNTHENVLYTLRYITEQKGLSKILIISSDYHIFRISMLISKLNKEKGIEFFFQGTETNYMTWRGIKTLVKESLKVINASAMLLLWESYDVPATN